MVRTVLLAVFVALVLTSGPAALAQSASEMLEKGIYTEQTVGDLDAAIEIYEKIVGDAKASRTFAARAQYRLGQCLLKQGKQTAAEEAFRALIKDFADQKELVARAREHVPGNEILDAVWGRSVIVTSRSVDRCVTTLRAKIEPDPRHPTYIQTIRDIGYRFEIPEATSYVQGHDTLPSE